MVLLGWVGYGWVRYGTRAVRWMSVGCPLDGDTQARGPLARGVGCPLLDQFSGVLRPFMDRMPSVLILIYESREHEGLDEKRRIAVPARTVGDVLNVDPGEAAVLRVIHAPPPQRVQMADSGDLGDAKTAS